MARFLKHVPCDHCGSSDAGAIYDDGSYHCFSCRTTRKNYDCGDMTDLEIEEKPKTFLTGTTQDIPNRGLREDTCSKFGYSVGDFKGEPCHIATYRDDKGNIVAQKLRLKGKKFTVIGNGKDMPLYGQHVWGSGGKSVVITEGEIDALSVSQAFNNRWPVVSLPNGAQSAVKAVQNAYEWLSSFEKIVLCFDNDEPGKEATEAVAAILPAGKAYVMRLPRKDANEVLLHDGESALTQSFWNAQAWRPDGIVSVGDLREAVLNPPIVASIPYPWSGFNEKLVGLRRGELVTFTAGSGIGKSTAVREILHHLVMKHDQCVGGMFLEESNSRTMEHLVSIELSKNIVLDRDSVTRDDIAAAFDRIAGKRLYLWDHFGSNHIDAVTTKIRYMARALGVEWVVLDHLSILVSGIDTGDERRTIDVAMTTLRTLTQELGIGMLLVSHLRRPEGNRGHEDGAEVSMGQLRGSHAIAQLSDAVVGFQKDPDDPLGNSIIPVCLKNRFAGSKGLMGTLSYDRDTGRLTEYL